MIRAAMRGKTPNEELKRLKRGGAGMRRLLLDDLREERQDAPRPLSRNLEGYMDGAELRPLYGIHKAARLAEHYLHRTRYGRPANRRFAEAADALYFDVRQAIATLVHNWRAGAPLPRSATKILRPKVAAFSKRLAAFGETLCSVRRAECPCCRGTGRIFGEAGADRAVVAVLEDAVKAGRLAYEPGLGYYGIG